jgi:hypothetical protein
MCEDPTNERVWLMYYSISVTNNRKKKGSLHGTQEVLVNKVLNVILHLYLQGIFSLSYSLIKHVIQYTMCIPIIQDLWQLYYYHSQNPILIFGEPLIS